MGVGKDCVKRLRQAPIICVRRLTQIMILLMLLGVCPSEENDFGPIRLGAPPQRRLMRRPVGAPLRVVC